MNEKKLIQLSQEIQELSFENSLAKIVRYFGDEVVFSTSFSIEDQLITDALVKEKLPVNIFTLDTGRLFPETYSVWSRTLEFYKTPIEVYYPEAQSLENFVRTNGPNAFYDSADLRKACCHVRKVEPLKRALKNKKLWITGLRKEHSPGRNNLLPLEWDEANQLVKFHPLLNWSTAEVKKYIHQKGIPYNPLHDKGFVSIGCAPCTRAVKEGEDFRAGRWWWEDASKKECGLHSK